MGRLQKGFFYKIKTIAWVDGAQFISPDALLSGDEGLDRQLKADIGHLPGDKTVVAGEKPAWRCRRVFIGGFI